MLLYVVAALSAGAAAWIAYRASPRQLSFVSPVFLFVVYYSVVRLGADAYYARQWDSPFVIVPPLLGLVFMALGALSSYTFSRVPRRALAVEQGALFEPSPISASERAVSWAFIIFGVLAAVVLYYLLGQVPLFKGVLDLFDLGADDGGMHAARRAVTRGHRDGQVGYFGQGYLRAIFQNLLPIGTLMLALDERRRRGRLGFATLVMLMLAVILQVLRGQIWPGVMTASQIMITFLVWELLRRPPFQWRFAYLRPVLGRVLPALVGIFLLAAFLRYLQHVSGRSSSDSVISAVFRRIFLVPTARLYDLFPNVYDFRWGQTWLNDLGGFLPGPTQSFAYEVHVMVHEGSYGFTLSPTLFGSMYVNFGLLGVIIFSFLFGWLTQGFGFSLLRGRSLRALVMYSWYANLVMLAATSDIVRLALAHIMPVLVSSVFWLARQVLAPVTHSRPMPAVPLPSPIVRDTRPD